MSSYFPEELLIEILSRVPAKYLVSFLLVSKSWCSLIKSHNFITTHLKNVRQGKIPRSSSLLLFRRYTISDSKEDYAVYSDDEEEGGEGGGRYMNLSGNFTQLDCPVKPRLGYFRILGTCDGLVCLCDDLFATGGAIYIWNPSVRKYLELPSPTINPTPLYCVFGLGVDDIRGDYKVVRIVYSNEDGNSTMFSGVEIFSLNTGGWRRIVNVALDVYITDFKWSQAFLNGALHWIAYCPPRSNANGGLPCSLILRFDVVNELFDEITLPDELAGILCTNLVVSVYKGLLCVTAYHRAENNNGSCSIWVMKNYGVSESWTRLLTMDLVEGIERVVRFRNSSSVLVAKGTNELGVFNPKTSQIQELGIFGAWRSFCIDNFEETLVLLGMQNVIVEEDGKIDIEESSSSRGGFR